ncbi:MAG: GNAT family N-acetyltransferase [Bacilli bacterium]
MIRKATINDFDEVFPLLMMASQCVYESVLGTTDSHKIKSYVKKLYNDSYTKISYKNIIVYDKFGKIAGCVAYFDSKLEKEYNIKMESFLHNNNKFGLEGILNTNYIDSIAVYPKYQGQKISKKLIEYINNESKLNVSLIAENTKTKVIEYYKRLGFKPIGEIKLYDIDFTEMILK